MIDLLVATVAEEEEPSKTLYYIAGAALVVFAIGLSVVGFTRPAFPTTALQARAVMAASVAVTLFVMVAVVATS